MVTITAQTASETAASLKTKVAHHSPWLPVMRGSELIGGWGDIEFDAGTKQDLKLHWLLNKTTKI